MTLVQKRETDKKTTIKLLLPFRSEHKIQEKRQLHDPSFSSHYNYSPTMSSNYYFIMTLLYQSLFSFFRFPFKRFSIFRSQLCKSDLRFASHFERFEDFYAKDLSHTLEISI